MSAAASPAAAAELPLTPGPERLRELAEELRSRPADGRPRVGLIPVWHSFIADCETPVSAFLKLRGLAPEQPAFLLESADQGQRVGRYSFIGVAPRATLRWSLADGGDPYALAAAAVASHRQLALPDLGPFAGGAVGYFGYDLVRTVEPLGEPGPDPLGLPDMALMLTDGLVVFDHLKHTITILANAHLEDEGDPEQAYELAARTIASVRERLAGPVPGGTRSRASASPSARSLRVEHVARALRSDCRPDRRVHPRRRRLPGRALPALVRARPGRGLLDLPRPAHGQPKPIHVLPGLLRLPGRGREP